MIASPGARRAIRALLAHYEIAEFAKEATTASQP
jgi:hypothetical protein